TTLESTPDNDRTDTGCAPDKHRTPRAFRLCASRCAEGARDGVLAHPAFALRPGSHLFLTFFRWLEANRAEREASPGRAVLARSSERTRRPLTRFPRSVHSPAKMGEISTLLFRFNKFACGNRKLLDSNLNRQICFVFCGYPAVTQGSCA